MTAVYEYFCQITLYNANTSITQVCWYGRKHPYPQWQIVERRSIRCKSLSKIELLFVELLEYIEDPGNYQLAVLLGDLKRLTLVTSIPNIALKTVNFYSP